MTLSDMSTTPPVPTDTDLAFTTRTGGLLPWGEMSSFAAPNTSKDPLTIAFASQVAKPPEPTTNRLLAVTAAAKRALPAKLKTAPTLTGALNNALRLRFTPTL